MAHSSFHSFLFTVAVAPLPRCPTYDTMYAWIGIPATMLCCFGVKDHSHINTDLGAGGGGGENTKQSESKPERIRENKRGRERGRDRERWIVKRGKNKKNQMLRL